MAKQVGLFGLRGKIENKSFYKTAGVQDTVIRQIPEGLGSRVKTADEYANTRLNNAEFKNANSIATAAFGSVANRKRGMMRLFAIAEMTKKALENIKQGSGDWGVRHPSSELDSLIVDLLENHAKGGSYDGQYGDISFVSPLDNTGEAELAISLDEEKITELKSLGIDGMMVLYTACLAGEKDIDDIPRLYAGSKMYVKTPQDFPSSGNQNVSILVNIATPSDVAMSQSGYTFATEDPKHGFYCVITFLPYRKQGGKMYTLQEACTYAAIALGQIPE